MSYPRFMLLLVTILVFFTGCTKSLSPEDVALLEQLRSERTSLKSDIVAAETEAP